MPRLPRPNAKIRDARKRKSSQRAGGYTLPPVVQKRIADAGASAYEWRDSILLNLYQPPQGVRVALRVGFWVLQALLAVAVTLVALQGGAGLVAAALAIPMVAVALLFVMTKTPSAPPTISWVAAAGIAAMPMIVASPSWGALGVALLILAALISAEEARPLRGEVSAWASAISTVGCAALTYAANFDWGPSALWVAVLIVTQVPICIVQRSFRSVAHRITPEDLRAKVPDPEFRWQGMVDGLRKTPGLPFIASAFSSHGWLDQVLENPPERVMAEARKKAAGAYGERKTGVILLGLSRGRGTMILHDIALPGAKSANIDHVVITKNRDGKSCAFIIDSKFYGPSRLPSKENPNGRDPGEVTYDMATGSYVYRLGFRAREIDQSISTALWGADAIRHVTGIEDVRVIMAIHNANVAPYLSFSRKGVPVEIMSAWSVVDHIERESSAESHPMSSRFLRRASGPLSPIQEARVAQGLAAASGSRKPTVYAPLGRTRKAREFMEMQSRQARGGAASAPERPHAQPSTPPQGPVSPVNPVAYPHLAPVGTQGISPSVPQAESAFQKADRAFFDSDPSEWADDAPPHPPIAPAQSAPDRIEGLWEQMRNSVPAPLDDVPAQYQQIVRGTALTITSFSDEHGPTAQDVVAITGVCVGAPGALFLWYCSTEGWKQYQATGTPVFISTIEADSVIVRARGGE